MTRTVNFYRTFLNCLPAILILQIYDTSAERVNVGIVGAGVGGTSAAFFLKELFGDDVIIDIFEKAHVGGRLAPITISGVTYNAGARMLVSQNLYMVNFTDILGIERDYDPVPGRLGIFDGEDMVFTTSDYSALSLLKLYWRYGMDVYNINGWISDKVMKPLDTIYRLQKNGHAYSTVEDLISAMSPNLVDYSKKSVKDLLKAEGFGDQFIDEFVMSILNGFYGQNTDVHGLQGGLAMVGMEGGHWNVKGGNHKVPQGLLHKSGANLVRAEVNTISLASDGSPPLYQIDYTPTKTKEIRSKEYDIVIIASPLYQGTSSINFEDFPSDIRGVDLPFHTIVTTFMEGLPNCSYFKYNKVEDLPSDILTSNESVFFSSFTKHKPVNSEQTEKPVYVIYSNTVPNKGEIETLVPEYTDLRMVEWKAHPYYPSSVNLPSFTLHDQMYHISAIETAYSSMETSVIGAKNVALLAYYRHTGQYDKIDEIGTKSDENEKTEL